MNRDILLVILILLTCGPLAISAGLLPALSLDKQQSGRALERASWTRLWIPLFPAACFLAMLLGWAFQEPRDSDEAVHAIAFLPILPFAAVWLRAIVRALWSAFPFGAPRLAATVGLVRPQIVIDPVLSGSLDAEELQATYAHEAAHQRHRDPLRIWVAQLLADLQGPWRSVRARLDVWLQALEIARDEEARERGACGAALASAVIVATKVASQGRVSTASLTGKSEVFRDRIERLLAPMAGAAPPRQIYGRALLVAVALLIATTVGHREGETLVRAIPGVVGLEDAGTRIQVGSRGSDVVRETFRDSLPVAADCAHGHCQCFAG